MSTLAWDTYPAPKRVRACYNESSGATISENPLLACLPPLKSEKRWKSVLKKGGRLPLTFPSDNDDDATVLLRIGAIDQFFYPGAEAIALASELEDLLFNGYAQRGHHFGSFEGDVASRRAAFLEAWKERKLGSGDPSQGGAALIGASGRGKTMTLGRISRAWPQVVEHVLPRTGSPVALQVVWLMVDAPPKPGVRALCMRILEALDRVLGTEYRKNGGRSTEDMLMKLRDCVDNHCLGMLIVDEMQNLSGRGVSKRDATNVLVELVNSLHVPLVVAGTPAMRDVLTNEVRLLRRVDTNAHRWNPLDEGEDFEELARAIVENALALELPWNAALRETLFTWSQGMPALLVTLLRKAQREALADGRHRVGIEDLEAVGNSWSPPIQRIRRAIMRQRELKLTATSNAFDDVGLGDVAFV